jgi:hypothetical protein
LRVGCARAIEGGHKVCVVIESSLHFFGRDWLPVHRQPGIEPSAPDERSQIVLPITVEQLPVIAIDVTEARTVAIEMAKNLVSFLILFALLGSLQPGFNEPAFHERLVLRSTHLDNPRCFQQLAHQDHPCLPLRVYSLTEFHVHMMTVFMNGSSNVFRGTPDFADGRWRILLTPLAFRQ